MNNKVDKSIARVLDNKIVKIYAIPTSSKESEFYYIGIDTERKGRLSFSVGRYAESSQTTRCVLADLLSLAIHLTINIDLT